METNPADGRGSGEPVVCDGVAALVQVIQCRIVENSGTLRLENPPLCGICAGLLGVAEGDDEEVKYEAAVREVDLVLIAKYKARQSSNPGAPSSPHIRDPCETTATEHHWVSASRYTSEPFCTRPSCCSAEES